MSNSSQNEVSVRLNLFRQLSVNSTGPARVFSSVGSSSSSSSTAASAAANDILAQTPIDDTQNLLLRNSEDTSRRSYLATQDLESQQRDGNTNTRQEEQRGNNSSSRRTRRENHVQSVRCWAITAVFMLYFPQIVAGIVVASTYGNKESCAGYDLERWLLTFVGFLSLTLVTLLLRTRAESPESIARYDRILGLLDSTSMILMLVGGFGLASVDETCSSSSPHIYNTCLGLLILNTIITFLPCLIVLISLPFLCFCLPCVIRVLSRFADPKGNKGASDEQIQRLPVTIFRSDTTTTTINETGVETPAQSSSHDCAICLADFVDGEEIRILPCKHSFHRRCVDDWLKLNKSCPICRQDPLPDLTSTTNTTTDDDDDDILRAEQQQQHVNTL